MTSKTNSVPGLYCEVHVVLQQPETPGDTLPKGSSLHRESGAVLWYSYFIVVRGRPDRGSAILLVTFRNATSNHPPEFLR